jgi:flagellar basal-body rod protein FlgG
VATARVFTQGNLQQTDNNLDIAINGNGFFQIQMPDGTVGVHPRRFSSASTRRASW